MSVLDKLAKVEALIARATSEGEQQAARLAKERILAKIIETYARPLEYKTSHRSLWEKRLFVAICSKHGFQTYRYQRQKHTTTNLRVSKSMMDEVIWPEYTHYARILEELVDGIMGDLIGKIHCTEEEEIVIAGEIGLQEELSAAL